LMTRLATPTGLRSMRWSRPRRVVLAAACAATTLAGGGTAIALAGGSPSPPPKPLDQAIAQAISANRVGISADVTLSSDLLPSGTPLGRLADGFLSGSGHLWVSDNDQGRLDLQTGAGRVSAAWDSTTLSVYVAALNSVYRVSLPQPTSPIGTAPQPPTLAAIDRVLARIGQAWTISQPRPSVVAGQPAYTVSISPRQSGSLLASVELTWEADHGTPLRAAVYTQGAASPALQLDLTKIVYGPVSDSDLQASFPPTATVTDLGSILPTKSSARRRVSGLPAVTAAAGFPVAAPDIIGGRSRSSVDLRDGTVFIRYGEGINGIALIERKTATSTTGHGFLDNQPSVTVGGVRAHELTTTLGSALTWHAGGTTYVLAGSVPSATLGRALSQVS